jgi:transcriptional regulator with XRE-family HTH domain
VPVGHKLKALRDTRNLTVREVEQATLRIADYKNDKRFLISNGWLTRLEKGVSEPSIYKLFSLSVVYNVNFITLLKLYDIDMAETAKLRPIAHPDSTQLLSPEIVNDPLPVASIQEARTNLLMGMTEIRVKLQLGESKDLNVGSITYGYIGLEDFTMYPLIRPGAIVRIDVRQNRFSSLKWHTEYERPIYFFELRGAYACGWCELHQRQLLIIPHHSSPVSVRRFAYPQQVEIVGRVVSFDTQCIDSESRSESSNSVLLRNRSKTDLVNTIATIKIPIK